MKCKSLLIAFLLSSLGVFAGTFTVEVSADRADAVYRCGEPVTVTARVLEDGKPVSGRTVTYELLADGGFRKKGQFISDAVKPFVWKHTLSAPGALREFILLDENGKPIPLPPKERINQVKTVSGRIGAVAEPEKILPAAPRPDDFDDFWKEQLANASKVNLEVLEKKPVAIPKNRADKLDLWDVKVACDGGMPVSGYLAMPKGAKPKSLPAVLKVQGAGVGSAVVSRCVGLAEEGAIVMEINAHGILNGQNAAYYKALREGKYKLYYTKVYPSREEHYFRGMILRVVRALEYLRSLPEWNGRDLVIFGASQGGFQAVAGAALDPNVTLCCAGVPAFADFDAEFSPLKRMERIHFGLAIRKLAKKNPEMVSKWLAIQSYFDPANLAPRIKAETHVTVGYVDLSCSATSVYGIYNRLPGGIKKSIIAYPAGVHGRCPQKNGNAALEEVVRQCKRQN